MRIPVLLCCIFFAAKAGGIFLVEDPWPPFTYGKHSHPPTGGLAVEAVQKIFEKQPLTLKLYPWQRAINMVKHGKADGMMLTVATSRRKNDFVFSKAIFHEPVVFVSLKKHAFVFESMADLRGQKIGTVNGSKYSDRFQKGIKRYNLDVEKSDSVHTSFVKLLHDRIDVTPVSYMAAKALMQNSSEFAARLKLSDKPLAVKKLRLAAGKESALASKMPQINTRIENLRKKGFFQSLYRRYE